MCPHRPARGGCDHPCAHPCNTLVRIDTPGPAGWAPSRAQPLPMTREGQAGRLGAVTPCPPWQVNVEDTVEMLPKSRRALTIQEIAALARSSLHGN